jgi:hypothetical protein
VIHQVTFQVEGTAVLPVSVSGYACSRGGEGCCRTDASFGWGGVCSSEYACSRGFGWGLHQAVLVGRCTGFGDGWRGHGCCRLLLGHSVSAVESADADSGGRLTTACSLDPSIRLPHPAVVSVCVCSDRASLYCPAALLPAR